MPAITSILIGTAIAAAATATTLGAVQAGKSEKEGRKAAEESQRRQDELARELSGRQKAEGPEAQAEANAAARRRQRNLAAQAFGRRDTILTGPLGLTSESETGRKTLLGV